MKTLSSLCALLLFLSTTTVYAGDLAADFATPPEAARPWVYWYFMDGNLTREGMTADLEAMKKAGIGGALFLEVGIGIPRGPVEFMSPQWRQLLTHAIAEADRLGLQFALGSGPGWCGSGGPWVKPEQSMQHLVASETAASGPSRFDAVLPRPQPRTPYFGMRTLTPELEKAWREYYRDVVTIAFPTPEGDARIPLVNEKALYFREPYSSKPGVRPFIPAPADFPALPVGQSIATAKIIDLTSKLSPDGRLAWDVPPGKWTIMRFGRTTTGQTSRPAPAPGLGLESDKFERAAVDAHFESFVGALLKDAAGPRHPGRGLTTLHFDSWEMSSQNWSEHFREEFKKRRGYDPLPYLPAMIGRIVESSEISERFLWDLRQTAQELVVENHALRLKELGAARGMEFSIEPYDLNPCADLALGAVADVPMCEFWSKGYGFSSEFSVLEAASLAHVLGHPVVGAEAFTANASEGWRQYPGSMKDQGDWALCAGINRFVFHRYQHQPTPGRFPGMTMGPYGVHWESTETWWDMVPAYHTYLTRCQALLRRGQAVADILYLIPEGAPHVFRPPSDATTGNPPDRRGYNFDAVAPGALARATVADGRITFPSGMSYRVLVLPEFETMTPELLNKIKELTAAGATVIGAPPRKSPSLVAYPQCDARVKELAASLWGEGAPLAERAVGQGKLILDTAKPAATTPENPFPAIYPSYDVAAQALAKAGVAQDFESDGNLRYIHRREGGTEIYFVSNREQAPAKVTCRFRVAGRQPECWDPNTGARRDLPEFTEQDGVTAVPLCFEAGESAFVIFQKPAAPAKSGHNAIELKTVATIAAPWTVAFDPKWGAPEKVVFEKLDDWSTRPEPGLKNYSGKAVYHASFDVADAAKQSTTRFFLALGDVKNLASVKLNGQDLGSFWCAPWRVEIPSSLLKEKGNTLEITVANLWINRLIGDAALPKDKKLAWTTWNPYKKNSPLQPSGLLGPVTLLEIK